MLPERDHQYLSECWPDHVIEQDGGMVAVVLPGYEMPAGFEPRTVDLLLRLPFGYPDTQPDMFWLKPFVSIHGAQPPAAEQREVYLGRTWQRFSRHLAQGAWRSGVDGLQSYLALITTMLDREAQTPVTT